VTRSDGNVALTFSDWGLGETETDLSQTPMRSPTVFNFFEPDYRHPGMLAQAGLITPEFQLTSDTTVVRQANFIYNGIFNDLHGIQGLSSFNNGGRDIALDCRPWMGNGPGGLPWTHNNNLNELIDKLNLLLLAGQLPSSGTNNYLYTGRSVTNAKQAIYDYLTYTRSLSSISAQTTPLTPLVVTVNNHLLAQGQKVTIAGTSGGSFVNAPTGGTSVSLNGTYTATVTDPNTFTIPIYRSSTGTVNLTNSTLNAPPTSARDRIKAIVHLMVTSPDFTIQR
jgi:hypothetical protein